MKRRLFYKSQEAVKFLLKHFHVYGKWLLKHALQDTRRLLKAWYRITKKTSRFIHHHVAKRPHNHLRNRYAWYNRWHSWNYHRHIHYSVLSVYLVIVGAMVLVSYGKVVAASDLFDNFDFSDAGN